VPVDKCLPLLDQNPVARLSSALSTTKTDTKENNDDRPTLGRDSLKIINPNSVPDISAANVVGFHDGKMALLGVSCSCCESESLQKSYLLTYVSIETTDIQST
jgi:hypothetical protein